MACEHAAVRSQVIIFPPFTSSNTLGFACDSTLNELTSQTNSET